MEVTLLGCLGIHCFCDPSRVESDVQTSDGPQMPMLMLTPHDASLRRSSQGTGLRLPTSGR